MQGRLTNKPVEEVIAAIQALDLESVKLRVMDPELGEGWSREYADSIEAAYKNYLTMLAKYQDDAEDIMLSKDVDEFWHTHILQTMKYADDCQKVFGTFLHHNPHIGPRTPEVLAEREALAEKTRKLYETEFGDVQNAREAWSGNRIGAAGAAMPSVAIGAGEPAFETSNAAIRAPSAAMSSVAIRAEQSAMSSIAIRPQGAAMSSVAVRASNTAMSSVAIRAQTAAMSSVAIKADNAAMSSIAITTQNAAMSSVAITRESAMVLQ